MNYLRKFLLLLTLQLVASPLFACSQRPGDTPPTDRELFERAKAVFVAHVYRTEERFLPIDASERAYAIVEGDFRVIEVLKGIPSVDGNVKSLVFGPRNCALVLLAGLDYIFFIQEGHELVFWPDGSQGIANVQSTESKKFLEIFRQMATGTSEP